MRNPATTGATVLLTACAAMIAITSGCAGYAMSMERGAACSTDHDCSAPFICIYGGCYDPSSAALQTVAFEVAPPSQSGLQAQQLGDFVVNSQQRSEIRLASSVAVAVRTLSASGTPLHALISAETRSLIPGRSQRDSDTTSGDGRAALTLLVGRSYDLSILPDDNWQVPFRPESVFVNADLASLPGGLTLQAPASDQLTRLRGRAVVSSSDARGIPELKAQLYGPVGTPPEMRVVSTSAMTDGSGAFELTLPSEVDSGLELRLAPTASNPYFPVVTVTPIDLASDTDLGLIEVGNVGTPLQVSGTVRGPGGNVEGAAITFVGEVGQGRYSATAITRSDGSYAVDLLAGDYQAVVETRSSVRGGLLEVTDAVRVDYAAPGTTTIDFDLLPRARVQGAVYDMAGEPVAGAQLVALRLGNALDASGPANEVHSSFEALSSVSGGYELALDAGRYELSVIPPRGVHAPRRTDVVAVGLVDMRHDLQLVAAAPFGGRVVAPDGATPVANATVRAYIVLSDTSALLIGEETTDAAGTLSMLLPKFSTNAGAAP